MIEERQRLEIVLEDAKRFLVSPTHREFVAATQRDLAAIESRILEDDLVTLGDFITLLDLRAQRRVLAASLTSFEDTVTTLEARINQMKVNEENQNVAKQETENNDNETETT